MISPCSALKTRLWVPVLVSACLSVCTGDQRSLGVRWFVVLCGPQAHTVCGSSGWLKCLDLNPSHMRLLTHEEGVLSPRNEVQQYYASLLLSQYVSDEAEMACLTPGQGIGFVEEEGPMKVTC